MISRIKNINPKIVFIGLHGAEGEDGRIQALMELEKIPFTGSGHVASAIAMNKKLCSLIASQIGIPVPPKILIDTSYFSLEEIKAKIGFPNVMKPNNEGSSIATFIINSQEDFEEKLLQIKDSYQFMLIEKFISGRELTVTVFDGKPLPIVEIIPKNGWYDFVNKYTAGNTEYQVPAILTPEETEKVQSFATKIFKEIGCEVYSRIDFRFDGEEFYFLEVNTLPGMTPLSLTPMSAKATGMSFNQLLNSIIETSLNIRK